jgi:hypothetical protein
MKKILVFIFGIGIFSTFTATAQIVQDTGNHSLMLIQTKNTADETVEGTPYLNDNFQPGTFTLEGKEPTNAFLRYNIVNEEMEIKTELHGEETYKLPVNNKATYQLGNEHYVFRNLKIDGNLVKGYFKEHYNGEKVSLYEKLIATTSEPVKAQTAYQKDKPARIVIEERFFLMFDNENIEEVRLKAKDFKKALPDTKAVNSYLSDNKVKTVEDFAKMLEWYEVQQ